MADVRRRFRGIFSGTKALETYYNNKNNVSLEEDLKRWRYWEQLKTDPNRQAVWDAAHKEGVVFWFDKKFRKWFQELWDLEQGWFTVKRIRQDRAAANIWSERMEEAQAAAAYESLLRRTPSPKPFSG